MPSAFIHLYRQPRGWRATFAALLVVLVATACALGLVAAGAVADNASTAAAFIEGAQNADGGFGAEHGQHSDPQASLWSTVALLAAGKNPQAEQLNNGSTADDYLAAHLSEYRSLTDLGLLALVQSAAGVPAARYGDPAGALEHDLSIPAVRGDPGGTGMAILGLLATNTGAVRAAAVRTARTLLGAVDADGGWGAGSSNSAATALVLEAVAQSGVATASNPVVSRGITYVHKAQVNDGSIATSIRTDASSSGDPASTAFTIQALEALHVPTLRTPTGVTVVQGLASYQQQGTGGLSQFGAYDTGVAPSVIDTAQAYPAFDGVAFPLPGVPYTPPSSQTATTRTATTAPPAPKHTANRISAGTAAASKGISANAPSSSKRVGAFRGASAAGSEHAKPGKAKQSTGTAVSGPVVGATQPPKLTTVAGRKPSRSRTALYLGLGLLACALLGVAVDARRPRRDSRSRVAVAVQAVADFAALPRTRRAVAPATALLIGAALVAVPFATGMWHRAPRAAAMLEAFKPYMDGPRAGVLAADVATLDAGIAQASTTGERLQFPRLDAARARTAAAAADPELALFSKQWTATDKRLHAVLDPIQANRGNYAAVAALPSFRLFGWFLLAPGVILIVLAATALALPRLWRSLRWGMLAVGVVLVLAPLALGMFERAPRGQRLVRAFATVETRGLVTALQDDFATLTIGQSALTSELLPGVRHAGADQATVTRRLPAVLTLDRRWAPIVADLTPVLGVMSDNVANYRATADLPDFTIFPWLFAIPGLLVAAVVLTAGARRRLGPRHETVASESQPRSVFSPPNSSKESHV
jgi:hypothetical protein